MRILLATVLLALLATACAPIPAVATDKTPIPSATNPAPAYPVYQVTADYLNVRSGPGMQYPADPRPLYNGERVRVYEERDGWCRVAADRWCWCYWLAK